MTLFEYITVAVSLVLALAVARTLDGLRSSLTRGRRYWVHAAWVIVKLTNPMTFWLGIWRFRDVATWDVVSFMLVLGYPAVLYLQVTSLVGRQPELVTDWRAHFYSQHRWFFGANLCLNVIALSFQRVLAEGTGVDPINWLARASVLALSLVGFATTNGKAHGAVVVGIIATVVLGYWVPLFAPPTSVP